MEILHRSYVECIDCPGNSVVRVYDVDKDTFRQRLKGKKLKCAGNFIGALQSVKEGEEIYLVLYVNPQTLNTQIMATAADFHQLECSSKILCYRPPFEKKWVLWTDEFSNKTIGEMIVGVNFMAYSYQSGGRLSVTAISDDKIEEWSDVIRWKVAEYEDDIDTQSLEVCKADGSVIRVHGKSGVNGYQKLVIREMAKVLQKEALRK